MLLISLALPFSSTEAVEHDMSEMDHHHMPHEGHKMPATTPPPADHATHHHEAPASSKAPANARDPNAYSDGYDFGPDIEHSHREEHPLAALIVDRLEAQSTGNQTQMTYDWQAWWGKTDDRAVLRAEGEIDGGQFKNARNELLWGHALTPYWDTQVGVRYDTGQSPDRSWFAFGVQGLAPYWIYIEATVYVGEEGRTAFRFESEYDLLITQRLILQPRIEANFYSQHDAGRGIDSGLANFEGGLRLRYEIRREFAPYIGVEWSTISAYNTDETRVVAGVHFWF